MEDERPYVALRIEGTVAHSEREYFLRLLDEVEAADVKGEYASIIQNIRARWTRHTGYGNTNPLVQGDTKMVRKMAERLGVRSRLYSSNWGKEKKTA